MGAAYTHYFTHGLPLREQAPRLSRLDADNVVQDSQADDVAGGRNGHEGIVCHEAGERKANVSDRDSSIRQVTDTTETDGFSVRSA